MNKTLSDKIIHNEIDRGVFGAVETQETIEVEAVKSFIEQVKEMILPIENYNLRNTLIKNINTLAGDKLI